MKVPQCCRQIKAPMYRNPGGHEETWTVPLAMATAGRETEAVESGVRVDGTDLRWCGVGWGEGE
jgi:hypothetical protein